MVGYPTNPTEEIREWELDSVRWPAGCFDEDPRFHRTDPDWQDYIGALTSGELIELRGKLGFEGRDGDLDYVLASGWKGRILIWTGEWDSGGA